MKKNNGIITGRDITTGEDIVATLGQGMSWAKKVRFCTEILNVLPVIIDPKNENTDRECPMRQDGNKFSTQNVPSER